MPRAEKRRQAFFLLISFSNRFESVSYLSSFLTSAMLPGVFARKVHYSLRGMFAAAAAGALSILLAATPAFAFDPDIKTIEDSTVVNRFPAGSIVTRAKAEQALREVKIARSRMNELVEYSTRRCGENFFVNACIEDVRKAKLRQQRRLLAIETEARKFVRDDDARIEREKQAERDRKAAEPPKRVEPRKPRSANAAQESAAKNRAARENRAAEVKKREAASQEKASQEAAKREAYEKKLKDAEIRRAEREAKVKARAEERARKAREEQKSR